MGLARQGRVLEFLIDDDKDEAHVLRKDISESEDDEFARSVSVRDAHPRAFIAVDTDQRFRRAIVSTSRSDLLIFEPGDLCYFWRFATGCSPGMEVGQGHYYVDNGGRIWLSNCGM